MRATIILATLTIASPAFAQGAPAPPGPFAGTSAPADGTVLKNCTYSKAGDCPFNAVQGKDYLIRVWAAADCDGTIELVNPVGQVTKTISVSDFTDGCDGSSGGSEFRAALTGTFQLRYVPSEGAPPEPNAARADILTDCRADAKTQCVLPLGGRPQASEHSTNGDTDWLRLANLRRGKLYTITATAVDVPFTRFLVVDASGHVLAGAHVPRGSTTCSVRFRPKANGTYFLDIPNGYHRTLSMR
jgi:hypothetical protein